MEEKSNIVLVIYEKACRQFYYVSGLICSLIIPLILIPLIASFFLQFKNLDNTCLSFLASGTFYVILYFSVFFIITILWFIKRSIPKITKGKIGVLFGPAHTDEIRKEMEDLSTKLKKEIESKDFAKIISVKTLPPNIEVGDHLRNLQILGRARATVLICGNFENFTAKGKDVTGFSSFTISTNRLPVNPQDTPIVLGDAVAGRQLGWTSENTIHKNIVAKNLSEIARYIVGLSLIADFKYDKAQLILGPLLLEIKQKYNQKRLPVEIRRFKDTIRLAYVMSLVKKVSQEYNTELVKEKIFQIDIPILQRWDHSLNEALNIDSGNFDALLLFAIIRFLLKDVAGAKDSIRKSRQFTPAQNQSICDLSEAFLFCFEGDLREARKIYRKIAKNPPSHQTINGVFSFLCQAIEAFSDKPQIRFVYALLNDEYGDKFIASEEFAKFILETEGIDLYKQWNREAKFRIKRTEQSNENESIDD